ncbi:MAG TPA: rhomboid family intramembrane serine protease [Polyangiaceae bacterium]|nr:rhomboid family intramembrane serine protease [Polyangiaceae bacterium]
MANSARWEDRFSFGGRLPWAIGLLLSVVAVSSVVAAVSSHFGSRLFLLAALTPADVWHGEVWRLVTWSFVETSPLSLIFQCLSIYWFGTDLAGEWGSRRFLSLCGALVLVVGVCTCLAAQLDDLLMRQFVLGGWGWTCGMLVTWGLWFPHRVIRIYFVLPIRGYWFTWLTVGMTVLFAIYAGWRAMLPEFVAEGAAFAWFYAPVLAADWRNKRRAGPIRAKKRAMNAKRAQSVAYLRAVESHDDDPPPMPEDLEKRVHDLLRSGKPNGEP